MNLDIKKLLTPPFDDGELFKNLKLLEQELKIKKDNHKFKKIAILGGSTTSHLKDFLNIFLLNNKISTEL